MTPEGPKFKRLEDYGIIGNLESCALVGNDGSIDWCCFPHIDSPSIFAAILDPDRGGRFSIAPSDRFDSVQHYTGSTNVLNTIFDTVEGSATLTDLMPVSGKAGSTGHRSILRKLVSTRGKVRLEMNFDAGFDYGRVHAEQDFNGGTLKTEWDGHTLFLKIPGQIKPEENSGNRRYAFEMKAGETRWFILRYGEPSTFSDGECEQILDETCRFWTDWLHGSSLARPVLQGPWKDLIARSALVLKLLSVQSTGAVIAAPTTSLPESVGGMRNWDYRYSWIRDSSFTIQAFEQLGYTSEAVGFFDWLHSVYTGKAEKGGPENLKIVYNFDGKDLPPEQELSFLSGYMNSRPVRIGNAASSQEQLDIYGDLVGTLFIARDYPGRPVSKYWKLITQVADHVSKSWQDTDAGIWEFRFLRRHLTYSKLMCWIALDRAIQLAREYGLPAPLDVWTSTRDRIRKTILEKGFNTKLNSFVQAFDYDTLDSTSLLIPVLGFLPPDDPRVLGTIKAISSTLKHGDLLRRYNGDDGLPGEEGVFVICSFWLVQALALSGQIDAAQDEFTKILRYKSPLGLFSEEIDPRSGLQIGNFPQAFSHIGLINAALYIGKAQEKETPGPELIGSGKKGTGADH